MDVLEICKELISCPSVTPEEGGAITYLEQQLTKLGFTCHPLIFIDKRSPAVTNLFAKYGEGRPHLCFAGHTDVVPPGDSNRWLFPPFKATVHNGSVFGRGACDMKGAIACFLAAVAQFINHNQFKGSISFMITGDEEGIAINGTYKVLEWLEKHKEIPDVCLIGEPTAETEAGDTVKIGRRGSLTSTITVYGKQGHVAYPHLADNPIPRMLELLNELDSTVLDQGDDFFDKSNLEITSIDVGNPTTNMIPSRIIADIAIRFNTRHKSQDLKNWLTQTVEKHASNYHIDTVVSGEPFISKEHPLHDIVRKAIKEVCGVFPNVTTSGGTSDGRFIQRYCPLIELGLPNTSAHQINEYVALTDLDRLKSIYLRVLEMFFKT